MPVPLHGQVSLTASAQQLSASAGDVTAFVIKAPASNVSAAFIGASSVSLSNGFQLDPGDELSYERLSQTGQAVYQLRPSDFFVVGTTGDKVSWLASP